MTERKDDLEERIKACYRIELPDELLLKPAAPATEGEKKNYERELKERIARARQRGKQVQSVSDRWGVLWFVLILIGIFWLAAVIGDDLRDHNTCDIESPYCR